MDDSGKSIEDVNLGAYRGAGVVYGIVYQRGGGGTFSHVASRDRRVLPGLQQDLGSLAQQLPGRLHGAGVGGVAVVGPLLAFTCRPARGCARATNRR